MLYIQLRINCHHKCSGNKRRNITGELNVIRLVTFPVKIGLTIIARFERGLHAQEQKNSAGQFCLPRKRNLPYLNRERSLIVIFEPEVCDQVLASQMPQRVFQLHQLDEDVVFWI